MLLATIVLICLPSALAYFESDACVQGKPGAWCMVQANCGPAVTVNPKSYWDSVTVGQTTTRTGVECQYWTSQSPHEHQWAAPHYWEGTNATAATAENYCADPDGGYGPWCFTMSSTRWDYCFYECEPCGWTPYQEVSVNRKEAFSTQRPKVSSDDRRGRWTGARSLADCTAACQNYVFPDGTQCQAVTYTDSNRFPGNTEDCPYGCQCYFHGPVSANSYGSSLDDAKLYVWKCPWDDPVPTLATRSLSLEREGLELPDADVKAQALAFLRGANTLPECQETCLLRSDCSGVAHDPWANDRGTCGVLASGGLAALLNATAVPAAADAVRAPTWDVYALQGGTAVVVV